MRELSAAPHLQREEAPAEVREGRKLPLRGEKSTNHVVGTIETGDVQATRNSTSRLRSGQLPRETTIKPKRLEDERERSTVESRARIANRETETMIPGMINGEELQVVKMRNERATSRRT